uniref:O(6)-methylguanine-induced apoptosis 2 n=2 Tax=Macrostomum lignano TaxID=282301 RepID=A0A1I8FZ89_9PLAT
MSDSVQILHNDSVVKRIHGNPNGNQNRVRKGYSAAKPNSSIPSKYQTVVIDTADSKGFMSTAKRFNYDLSRHVTPAPNYYALGSGGSSVATDSPSYGKRGTGGLASKTVRLTDGGGGGVPVGPGPAGYNIGDTGRVGSRADFNQASATSSFHPPIAVPRPAGAASDGPGPNRYNTLNALARLRENRTRDLASVFKSSSGREPIGHGDAARRPGPGAYDVTRADRLVGEASRAPVSCFRPSGPRRPGPKPTDNPGPGAYDHEPDRQAKRGGFQFPMQHYLCLSAPALPLPPQAPLPGPGQYELAPRPVSKHYMSSSMFLSNTSRWAGRTVGDATSLPGPAHYQPEVPAKQNFSYNADGHWAV